MSYPRFAQLTETNEKPVFINGARVIAVRQVKIYKGQGMHDLCCEIVTTDGSIYVKETAEQTVRTLEHTVKVEMYFAPLNYTIPNPMAFTEDKP